MKHYIILGYDRNKKNKKVVMWGNLKNYRIGMNKLYDMLAIIRRNVENPNAYCVNFVDSNGSTWESVTKENEFYRGIKEPIDDVNEFISIVNNIKLNSLDIANLILYNFPTTLLKLQRILYLAYQMYLKTYKKKLFDDEFYAWEQGPVNREIYLHFTEFQNHIEGVDVTKEDDDNKIIVNDDYVDKITYHKDKEKIIEIITEAIDKFGKLSSNELIELTKNEESAWYKTPRDLPIKDTDIFNSNS